MCLSFVVGALLSSFDEDMLEKGDLKERVHKGGDKEKVRRVRIEMFKINYTSA